MRTIPDCLRTTNQFCPKHLGEECGRLTQAGALAVTVWGGHIIHVNGLPLLVERDTSFQYSEGCDPQPETKGASIAVHSNDSEEATD